MGDNEKVRVFGGLVRKGGKVYIEWLEMELEEFEERKREFGFDRGIVARDGEYERAWRCAKKG